MTTTGFGNGPYGHVAIGGGYGDWAEETRSTLSSSRKIDQQGRYVVNDEGGFEAMDDVAQTVMLRIAYAPRLPSVISPAGLAKRRNDLRAALASMTAKPAPLITIKTIEVTDSGRDAVYERIVFKNLRTNTMQTVEPR